MKKALLVIALLTPTCASAQQAQPSSNERALSNKLLQEIQSSLGCDANLISLQAELAKAQARVKELEIPKEQK